MKKLQLLPVLILLLSLTAFCGNPNPPSNDPPVVTITGNTTICAGSSTTLTASGASSYSWSVNGSTILPADGTDNVAFAVGLHKLRSAYTGPAMQVRRNGSFEMMDIGFVGNDLDIATLNTFLNGQTGLCVKLYDQSGHGRDLQAFTANPAPFFIQNGLNGRPVLRFFIGLTFMFNETNFTGTPYSIVSLAKQSPGPRRRIISGYNNNWTLGWANGANDQAYFEGWVNQPVNSSDNNPVIYSATGTGTVSSFYKNGILLASNANGLAAPNGIRLNGSGNGLTETSNCDIMDVIIFNTVLSDGQRNNVENMISSYYNMGSSGATITVSPTTTTTYTVTGTDANGSTSQTVTVTVNSTPVISCPQDLFMNLTSGNCSAVMNFPAASATGDEPIGISYSQNTGTVFPAGTTPVIATATDAAGCVSTCSFNITVVDIDPPQLNCPGNIISVNNSIVNYTAPVATDACTPGITTVQTTGLPAGSNFPVGITTNTFVATDVSGNTATCSFTVTVTDTQAPVISFPSGNISATVDPGQCTATVYYTQPQVSDNICAIPPSVLPGYTALGDFNGSRYFLSDNSISWADANTAALAAGGNLVSITSAAENNFLAAFNNNFWLGLTDQASEGTFVWSSGEPSGFTNWIPGEPNNSGDEDYAEADASGHWNDLPASSTRKYIIEFTCSLIPTLVSGPASGSSFPLGVNTVTWSAIDAGGNTTQASFTVTVNGIPSSPGSISGPTNVCPYINTGENINYAIDTVQFATGYQWTVPPTVSIVSGQGTNSITVNIGSGFISNINKLIKVKALSPCNNSAEKLLYLLAQSPSTAAAITASSADICSAIGNATPIVFKIPKTIAASSYIWTAQNGTTTITHPNGTGVNDTTISVIFSSGFTTSAITVQSLNDCGTGGVRSFTVTRSNPATPSLINGPTNVCANIGATGVAAIYTVAASAGTTFNWIVPASVVGLTGQGTNSISFTYPAGFTSGAISVTATNGCGTSGTRTLPVTRLNPSTPGVIDVIQTGFCPARTYTYTLAAMPANATSVQWTVPASATLVSGQGTSSITVSYPDIAIPGTVTATAINNCGTSTTRSVQVKLPACPPPTFTKGNNEHGNNVKQIPPVSTEESSSILIAPNPSTASFNLFVKSISKQVIHIRLLDVSGKRIKKMNVPSNQTFRFGNDLESGIYLVEIEQDGKRRTERIVKL